MEKNTITPNSNTQCLTFAQFDDYVNGRLSPEEAEAVKQHIDCCSDCREVFEAFEELDENFVDEAVAELNARIDARTAAMDSKDSKDNTKTPVVEDKTEKGRTVKLVFKYAAAAALAGVCIWVASQYVTVSNSVGNTVADDLVVQDVSQDGMRKSRQSEVPMAETQSSDAQQADADLQQDSDNPATPAAVASEQENTQKPTPAKSTDTPKKQDKTTNTNNSKKSNNATKTDALQDEFEAGVVTRSISITKPNSEKTVDTDKVEKLMVDAERFYNEKNYTVAKAVLERIVDEDPSNNNAIKKLAICDYHLGNYGQSLKNLRRVVSKDEQERREIEGYIDECLKHVNY